jgi:Family of unknown function (DUF6088)
MPESIEILIFRKISKARGGRLFFVENFVSFSNAKTVNKALERLTTSGKIVRAARGIYYKPRISKLLGLLHPSIEDIALAIAKRDKIRIVPTGAYALNRLGLSTQVPLNIVYLTDGHPRKIKIGKRTIVFKTTSLKNVSTQGPISTLVIQALRAIGSKHITESEIEKLQGFLQKERLSYLQHDYTAVPEWIRKIYFPIIKNRKDDK